MRCTGSSRSFSYNDYNYDNDNANVSAHNAINNNSADPTQKVKKYLTLSGRWYSPVGGEGDLLSKGANDEKDKSIIRSSVQHRQPLVG